MRRTTCVLSLVAAIWAAWAAVGAPPAQAAGQAAGHWRAPLPPPEQVLRSFEPPAHDWLPGHRGVDLAGHAGQEVLAAGAGTVTFAGPLGTLSVVAIRHAGGLETTYQPLRPLVRVGMYVPAGTAIGVLLLTGSHCLPRACLHWGLRRGETYLDPLSLIGATRVRLLPLLSGTDPGSWLAPAMSGASIGSSAVVAGWTLRTARRRRRRLPPGVVSLAVARRERASRGRR